jgi:membrane-associated protease RseP (regulator of RpoE activity)
VRLISTDKSPDELTAQVVAAARPVMVVEDVTAGIRPANSIRLRGRLLSAPEEAYDVLAENMRPLGRTPLLRKASDGDREEVLAMPITFGHARQRVGLAATLFVLTVLSCLFAGAQMVPGLTEINFNLLDGLPFAASLLVILAAHEFGHYLTARRAGTPTSLPYFIPLPIPGGFGTMGAFISMTAPPRDRRRLLAISVAGPLAGLILAVPILWLGLRLSHVEPLPPPPYSLEGNSLLYAALKYLVFGRLLPSGGEDVLIGQVAMAGWAGLLITGLNLIPAGQLDGGHIMYALVGPRRARLVTWVVLVALAGLAVLWQGWLIWLVLIFVFSRFQDMPLDDITDLTPGQRVLAVLMLALFLLVFTPIPFKIVQ